jgi:hypothetical protein
MDSEAAAAAGLPERIMFADGLRRERPEPLAIEACSNLRYSLPAPPLVTPSRRLERSALESQRNRKPV